MQMPCDSTAGSVTRRVHCVESSNEGCFFKWKSKKPQDKVSRRCQWSVRHVIGSRIMGRTTESQCVLSRSPPHNLGLDQKPLLKMTALKRLSLCILWLSVFLIFSACCAAGLLSAPRLRSIFGSLLGLIPASLHFRTSKTQTPPRQLWRVCSVLVIIVFGSLSFLAWVPGALVQHSCIQRTQF